MFIRPIQPIDNTLLLGSNIQSSMRLAKALLHKWQFELGKIILVRGEDPDIVDSVTREIANSSVQGAQEIGFDEGCDLKLFEGGLPFAHEQYGQDEPACIAIPCLSHSQLVSLLRGRPREKSRCTIVIGVSGPDSLFPDLLSGFDHVVYSPLLSDENTFQRVAIKVKKLGLSQGWLRHMLSKEHVPASLLVNCAETIQELGGTSRLENQENLRHLLSGHLGREIDSYDDNTGNTWDPKLLDVSESVVSLENGMPDHCRIACYGDTVSQAEEFAKAAAKAHEVELITDDVVSLLLSLIEDDDAISQLFHDARCGNNILLLTRFDRVYKGLVDTENAVVQRGCRIIMSWLAEYDGRLICIYDKKKFPKKYRKHFEEVVHFGPLNEDNRAEFTHHFIETELKILGRLTSCQQQQIRNLENLRIRHLRSAKSSRWGLRSFTTAQAFIDRVEKHHNNETKSNKEVGASHLTFDIMSNILDQYL